MDERVVLCVGDSGTYGSWPGALARELGASWPIDVVTGSTRRGVLDSES